METRSNIELVIDVLGQTIKMSSVETSLLVELGDFLGSRTLAGMLSQETQTKLSDFLFVSNDDLDYNRKEPILDFLLELYCNLELAGLDYDAIQSITRCIYQALTDSKVTIPIQEIRSRYIDGKTYPADVFLNLCCLIRLYIARFNNFVNLKSERENGEQK